MICTMINESLLWAECSGIGEGVAGVLAGDARRCAFLATRRRPTYPSRSPRPGPHPQWQGPVNNPRILPPSPPAVASSSHFPPQARSPLPPNCQLKNSPPPSSSASRRSPHPRLASPPEASGRGLDEFRRSALVRRARKDVAVAEAADWWARVFPARARGA